MLAMLKPSVLINRVPRVLKVKHRKNTKVATRRSMGRVHEGHVSLAHELADAAGSITRAEFRKSELLIIDKADKSPVTEIDRQVESTLREIIHTRFPGHSIFGEEYGMELGSTSDRDYLWILDPIDGTLSFITGKPLFGTLIALLYQGAPILGVIDQSVLGDRWTGVTNQQTLYNGEFVSCRKCSSLSSAYVYSTTPDMFPGELDPPYQRLKASVKGHLYGADCYAYGLLSLGHVDAVFEADMKVFDYMAMVPIVEGAGGVMTDWLGNPLVWNGVENGGCPDWPTQTLAVGDFSLHDAILNVIK